jgi:hypothetical protein
MHIANFQLTSLTIVGADILVAATADLVDSAGAAHTISADLKVPVDLLAALLKLIKL